MARSNTTHTDLAAKKIDSPSFEKDKIRGAIRTDFVLSTEIIVIALGTVAQAALQTQIATLVAVAIIMTVGVYGFVAVIVKIDDLGLLLQGKASRTAKAVGMGLVQSAPWLMKTLMVVGTAAMFLVGGSILRHGIPALDVWQGASGYLADFLLGLAAGAVLAFIKSILPLGSRKPQTS